jgi:hypothetical protein
VVYSSDHRAWQLGETGPAVVVAHYTVVVGVVSNLGHCYCLTHYTVAVDIVAYYVWAWLAKNCL